MQYRVVNGPWTSTRLNDSILNINHIRNLSPLDGVWGAICGGTTSCLETFSESNNRHGLSVEAQLLFCSSAVVCFSGSQDAHLRPLIRQEPRLWSRPVQRPQSRPVQRPQSRPHQGPQSRPHQGPQSRSAQAAEQVSVSQWKPRRPGFVPGLLRSKTSEAPKQGKGTRRTRAQAPWGPEHQEDPHGQPPPEPLPLPGEARPVDGAARPVDGAARPVDGAARRAERLLRPAAGRRAAAAAGGLHRQVPC